MASVSKKKTQTSDNPETKNFFNPAIKQEVPEYIFNSTRAQEIKRGIEHELKEVWFPPGRIGPLQPGSKFRECYDGWYQVYNEKGEKLHYRVGEIIIKEIFGVEANAAI